MFLIKLLLSLLFLLLEFSQIKETELNLQKQVSKNFNIKFETV